MNPQAFRQREISTHTRIFKSGAVPAGILGLSLADMLQFNPQPEVAHQPELKRARNGSCGYRACRKCGTRTKKSLLTHIGSAADYCFCSKCAPFQIEKMIRLGRLFAIRWKNEKL